VFVCVCVCVRVCVCLCVCVCFVHKSLANASNKPLAKKFPSTGLLPEVNRSKHANSPSRLLDGNGNCDEVSCSNGSTARKDTCKRSRGWFCCLYCFQFFCSCQFGFFHGKMSLLRNGVWRGLSLVVITQYYELWMNTAAVLLRRSSLSSSSY